jgi:hypothetical protein
MVSQWHYSLHTKYIFSSNAVYRYTSRRGAFQIYWYFLLNISDLNLYKYKLFMHFRSQSDVIYQQVPSPTRALSVTNPTLIVAISSHTFNIVNLYYFTEKVFLVSLLSCTNSGFISLPSNYFFHALSCTNSGFISLPSNYFFHAFSCFVYI